MPLSRGWVVHSVICVLGSEGPRTEREKQGDIRNVHPVWFCERHETYLVRKWEPPEVGEKNWGRIGSPKESYKKKWRRWRVKLNFTGGGTTVLWDSKNKVRCNIMKKRPEKASSGTCSTLVLTERRDIWVEDRLTNRILHKVCVDYLLPRKDFRFWQFRRKRLSVFFTNGSTTFVR